MEAVTANERELRRARDRRSRTSQIDIVNALRQRAQNLVSLSSPQDADLTDTAIDLGLGFVPGPGTALSARDFERARREGDALGMGLSAAGMIPVVGGVARGANALRKGSKAADALRAPRMSAQEARDAGYWHPIGLGKKLDRPYDEMTFRTEPVKDLPARRTLSLEDLQGQYIIPAVGDRTAAGRKLTEVDGVKLNNPVMLEGGPDFMLTHSRAGSPDSTIWASAQPIISKLRNRAVGATREGGEANLMYVPMGYNSLNFSTMPTDAALEFINSGRITKKAKKEFDTAVRSLRPEFAGLSSPEVVQQLRGSGELRHAFLDRMQLDQFRGAGFPDLSAIRKAVMEPALADVPVYHGGYSVGRIDTDRPIVKDPVMPHSTYNTQLAGEVKGGLDVALPHTELWADFFNARRAAGAPASGDRMAFERAAPAQLIDQRALDRLMPMVEQLRRRGE